MNNYYKANPIMYI